MALQTDGIVVKNERIKPLYFLLTIYCPPIANEIKTGQFIMLKVSDNSSPLLRRPFSVYKSYPASHPEKKKRGCLLILYKKVGKGTQKMTEFKKGQKVNVIGPLGNGFSLPPLPSSTHIILIGGGVGIVSLYSLAEVLGSHNLFVFIGGKTKDDILCEKDFKKLNALKIFIATEDGSLGYKGTVIDLFLSQKKIFKRSESQYIYPAPFPNTPQLAAGRLKGFLKKNPFSGPAPLRRARPGVEYLAERSWIYSCGPVEMLKELAKAVKFKGVVFQASLEARMGCGFGACWGCVVKTNDPNTPYQRVCKEGPVFNLKDIVWE